MAMIQPFSPAHQTVAALMWQVVIALMPGVLLMAIFFGVGVILHLAVAFLTAIFIEVIVVLPRKAITLTNTLDSIKDGSAAVLALIVAIAIPSASEWWVVVVAVAIASIFGKHLYGGTGQNLFNPAMVGIVFVLVCFPGVTNQWPSVSSQVNAAAPQIDGLSGATLLELERTKLALGEMRSEFKQHPVYGAFAQRGWEWINLTFFAGGLWLCWRGVIACRIPICFLTTLFLISSAMYGFDSTRFSGPFIQIFSGASVLCAFFVATDPVTSPSAPRAAIVYAILLALLVYVLRLVGGYPDAVAFSVILMNALVPLLDRFVPKRIYGH